eukprot:COSAG02_NODE_7984_length_2757_cov_6.599699_3_plen_133_part_00
MVVPDGSGFTFKYYDTIQIIPWSENIMHDEDKEQIASMRKKFVDKNRLKKQGGDLVGVKFPISVNKKQAHTFTADGFYLEDDFAEICACKNISYLERDTVLLSLMILTRICVCDSSTPSPTTSPTRLPSSYH